MRRRLAFLLAALALLALAVVAWGYAGATATPVVREAKLALPGWPAGAAPVRALLISDIHVAGPDMPPERLARIVAQINALEPDLVLIAGDLVSDKRTATHFYSMAEAVAPLAALRPRLGTIAVLGNHDHWRDARAAAAALEAAGVVLLDNAAVQAGPLAVGGLDDAFTGRHDLPATLKAMAGLKGARLLLSHSPDPFPEVPPSVPLMAAGHTHCGQIALPLIGPISTMSKHGDRYACGIVRENNKVLVVGAGVGTSLLPLRIGAEPDMWLLELGGA
ncbi:MAG: metallophosphoesterase [Allosphingosinicella sp.]